MDNHSMLGKSNGITNDKAYIGLRYGSNFRAESIDHHFPK